MGSAASKTLGSKSALLLEWSNYKENRQTYENGSDCAHFGVHVESFDVTCTSEFGGVAACWEIASLVSIYIVFRQKVLG